MAPRQQTVSTELKEQTARADGLGFSGLCWPGFTFDRELVRELGAPAYRWMPDGEFWEYEDGAFYLTGRGDRGVRRRADETDAPHEGWSHPADCACPACRVAKR
jgi:hypothetical protein